MRIRSSVPGPLKVVNSEQMRDLDRRATEDYGIPSLLLMENAGRAVADIAGEMLGGSVRGGNVLVLAGPGNNGGDGFVAARHLHNAGAVVTIAYYADRSKAKGDALVNIEAAEKMGLKIIAAPPTDELPDLLCEADLAVDALLGTGTKGEVRSPFSEVIAVLAQACVPVLAVDIPSGVDADTGAVLGSAVRADTTVTFALPKTGLVTYPGAAHTGELIVADISIPREALQKTSPAAVLLDESCASELAAARPQDSHKGDFGHVAIVAGSVGMTGAATLACEGALRIGAGLVTALVPESLNDIMEAKVTEAMTIPVPQGKARAFGMASLEKVLEYVNKWDSSVIGPGFGRDEDTVQFTLELLRRLEKPAILDADGLYALSRDLSVLRECKASLVITPHPGEMAALLGTGTAEVQANRLELARSFAQEHGVVVVLKGAATVIAAPDGDAYINSTGSPGMATGGTGDVLSGMIGGLLGQMDPVRAACAATYLHGLAGELAAEHLAEPAMIAGDVVDFIGEAIKTVSDSYEGE